MERAKQISAIGLLLELKMSVLKPPKMNRRARRAMKKKKTTFSQETKEEEEKIPLIYRFGLTFGASGNIIRIKKLHTHTH